MRLPYLLTPYALKYCKPADKTVSLENIRVAAPCPARWEKMNGDNRIRHCAECKLNVYNLSDMTRSEAEQLIATREGRLCVRFYRRADGTILTQDCPKGLQVLIRRVSRLAGTALSAMMTLGAAFAQTTQPPSPPAKEEKSAQQKFKLSFTVIDQAGAVIPGAQFRLTNSDTGITHSGKTRSDGVGVLAGLMPGSFVLRIESPGFKSYVRPVAISKDKPDTLRVVLELSEVMTGIVVLEDHIDHDNAALQTTISGDLLKNLPMR